MEMLKEVLLSSIITVSTTAIPVVTVYIVKLANRFREELLASKTQEEQQAINNRFKRIKAIMKDVVLFVEQTEVNRLKENGEWNEESKKNVKFMALDIFKKILSNEDMEFISGNVLDTEEWADVTLEAIVNSVPKFIQMNETPSNISEPDTVSLDEENELPVK